MEKETTDNDMPLLTVLPLLYKQVMSSVKGRQSGLTKTQIIILSSLAFHGTMHMSQIACYISSSKEQATRTVAALVDEGYVERTQDLSNRTRIYIRLTAEGQSFLDRCRSEIEEKLRADLAGTISPEEQTELLSAARTMARILGKLEP